MRIFYESPAVDLIEVNVENGFALSGGTDELSETPGTWTESSTSNAW